MASSVCVVLLSLLHCGSDGVRTAIDNSFGTSDGEDCSWAKLDTSTGWRCKTLKTFSGGMQGNTKLVMLYPSKGRKPFQAVLKEMNSNENPMGLDSLENEREKAAFLMKNMFAKVPRYYLDLKVRPEFRKYANSRTMTVGEKRQCDSRPNDQFLNNDKCKINPSWNACNGNRGNINTTVEIPRRLMKTKGLTCPDTQLLAMEYLDGYADLQAMQPTLAKESGFQREVRAAALFVAYDELKSAGVSHCDFNPGNAMFKKDNPMDVKIIDFGLARFHDFPTGACRGHMEDIGTPGHLWLGLYRGQRDANEFAQNDAKPGPLALGINRPFDAPNHRQLHPFSLMGRRFHGVGGTQPWNKETRENWPGIVAYAQFLLKEAANQFHAPSLHQLQLPDREQFRNRPRKDAELVQEIPDLEQDRPEEQRPAELNLNIDERPKPRPAELNLIIDERPKPKPESLGTPQCSYVYASRSGPCQLTLRDMSPCSITLKCPFSGEVLRKVISQDDVSFQGRVDIGNCMNCKFSKWYE